jgi:predicted O-methyltransferase YrrM
VVVGQTTLIFHETNQMNLPHNFHQRFASVAVRHKEASMIASIDDEPSRPTRRLIDVALAACTAVPHARLSIFDGRPSKEPCRFDHWPGEHYCLLNALVRTLRPRSVIEIGTWTGMGTLSLLQSLPSGGRITTFDLLGWETFGLTWLAPSDFADGRVVQFGDDVSTPEGIAPHRALFESADLIFIDGHKDGYTEAGVLASLATLDLAPNVVVVLDDIRVMNMIGVWHRILRPKMDLTSFGHWSGTGLIDWNGEQQDAEASRHRRLSPARRLPAS